MLDRIQVTKEVEEMCCVRRGVKGEPAPIPQEGDWTKVKEIKQISGLTHGCGCCAPHDTARYRHGAAADGEHYPLCALQYAGCYP